jgi:hypothetical protein
MFFMYRFLPFFLSLFLAFASPILAQNLPCGTVITDVQGAAVNYLPSQNINDTLSVDTGQSINLNFSQLELGAGDTLRIFDGTISEIPPLAVFVTGDVLTNVQSWGSSIIVSFTSDESDEAAGWEAQLLCQPELFSTLNFPFDSLCAGMEVTIPLEILAPLTDGMLLEAFLSDVNGSFDNPYPIGEAYTGASGLFIQLSADQPASDNYIIRLIINDSTGVYLQQDYPVKISRIPDQPIISGDSSFCGDSIMLSFPFQFRVDYQWYFQNDTLLGSTDSDLQTNLPGTYSVSATNSCGTVFSADFELNLIPSPQTPGVVASVDMLCPNDTAILSITADGDTSTYHWFNNGIQLNGNEPTIETAQPGDYYIVRTNLCGTSSSDTIQIIAISFPPASPITASGSLNFCEGNSIQLAIPDPGNFQITWFNNLNAIQQGDSLLNVDQPGSYSASLSNLCGETHSFDTLEVNVQLLPEPAVLSAAGPTTLCEGNSVVLFAEILPGEQSQWLLNGSPLSEIGTQLSASTTGVYSMNTINACGTVLSENTIAVTINLLPTQPSMYSLSTPALCNGSSVTLAVEAQTGVTYEWKRNGSAFPGTTNSISTLEQGVYSVSVTNGCGTLFSQNNISVISGAAPVLPSLTAGSTTTFCQGLSVTLTTTPQQGVLYRWLRDGIPAGSSSFSIQANVSGIYTVEVSNACDTVVSTSSISVNVLPPPVEVEVSPIGEHSVCQGDSLLLSIPAIQGVSYQWRRNSQALPFNTNSISVFQEGSYTIILGNSCGTTPASNAVYLNVDSIQPGVTDIVAQPSTALCPGGYVLLNTTPVPFQLYSWYLDGELIEGAQTAVLQATEWGTYTLQANNACGVSLASEGVTLGPGDPPSDFNLYTAGDSVFCSNDSLQITAQTAFGVSVRWFLNGAFLVEGPAQIFALLPGSYTANCWSGCGEAQGLNAITLTTIPAPDIPVITLDGSNLITTASGSLQWLDAAQIDIDGATTSSFSPAPVNASYFVRVTAPNGCSALSEPFHYNIDGMDMLPSTTFRMYPNPAQGSVLIQNLSVVHSILQLQLCDMTGREIRSIFVPEDIVLRIDLSDLKPGIYVLRNSGNRMRLVVY